MGRQRSPGAASAAWLLIASASLLGGCAVASVAGAAAGAAISVAGAVVSTGVKVTGKVVEKTIDVVTPDSKPADGS
jgi:hypothetical protein